MNVLIVGARGPGKTTLIRRVLESLGRPVSGFETEKEGDQVHIYVSGAEHVPTEENLVGLCGETVVREGGVRSIRRLSSLGIRIPRQHRGCAAEVYARLLEAGLPDKLIISPPGAGKTTLLRELVRLVSEGGRRVSLIDERGEAAGVWEGLPLFDVGP